MFFLFFSSTWDQSGDRARFSCDRARNARSRSARAVRKNRAEIASARNLRASRENSGCRARNILRVRTSRISCVWSKHNARSSVRAWDARARDRPYAWDYIPKLQKCFCNFKQKMMMELLACSRYKFVVCIIFIEKYHQSDDFWPAITSRCMLLEKKIFAIDN